MNKNVRRGLWIIGGLLLVFLVVGIVSTPESPSAPTTADASSPVSSLSPDASYVAEWNTCVEKENMNDVAAQLGNLSVDVNAHAYHSAINDVENAQTDVLYVQTTCVPQLNSYQPLTSQLTQVNSLTVIMLSNMSSSLATVLEDLQSAEYGAKATNDLMALMSGVNDYNKARELIAAWQSENPQ